MGRTRRYRREIRKRKIEYRKRKIRDVKGFKPEKLDRLGPYGRKIKAAMYGDKPGLLSKGYYRTVCSWVKTKARNGYASHRHKGAYGKAMNYSRRDKQQIAGMKMEMKEHDFSELIVANLTYVEKGVKLLI